MKNRILIFLLCISINTGFSQTQKRWSKEKATKWYAAHNWVCGADFIPSTAINQLEMWQKDTFDPQTIDKELGYAQNIGMNTMRVYLHSLAYKEDPSGFKKRIDEYLKIAHTHGIKTIFVFFDDCWNKMPEIGKQPAPKTGIHNSGWVQDPGDPAFKETTNFPALKVYVQDVLTTFKNDERVLLWDLYNEPGNNKKGNATLPLLKAVFAWAREIPLSQPISAGLWNWNLEKLNAFQAQHSDVITYHNYESPEKHERVLKVLKAYGRPMICTEYMARPRNSRFANILPMLKKEHIGAINWGLVSGKTNTIYAWGTPIENGDEPIEWFHDIFRKDGTPYREDEVTLIKKLTQSNP
ncbi:cellulase family glycosylhydrolase [Zhouia sp. PK063]|uniref:cellulase family glycosylhydrolase n=1 Tax=Zhouia sp. PK063 TaxID=3373602 RepID=UPI0037A349D2